MKDCKKAGQNNSPYDLSKVSGVAEAAKAGGLRKPIDKEKRPYELRDSLRQKK